MDIPSVKTGQQLYTRLYTPSAYTCYLAANFEQLPNVFLQFNQLFLLSTHSSASAI